MNHPRPRSLRALIYISGASICVHAALNTLLPRASFTISYLLWGFWTLLATIACLRRSYKCPLSVRKHWRLAATSLFFIFIAAAVEAPAEIFFQAVPTVASFGDFLFFSAFVPILLSITLSDEGTAGSTFFLDTLQAAACSYLAYTVLMGIFPFTSNPAQAMPYAPLEYVYDAEYLIVVLLAALRYVVGTRNADDRLFFRFILIYTSLYAITSGIYNHYVGKYSLTNGADALNDIPSAALALFAIFAPSASAQPAQRSVPPLLIRLINNARPVVLSLALIALSAAVAFRHLRVAFAFIFGSFFLYSLRSSMLQSRVEQAHTNLEELNSHLSEIALLDGLTGVSNRRGFDQRLQLEWGRAHRTGQPLSLLLIDVDHFKRVNDTHGHQAGDDCLRHIGQMLSTAVERPADLVARFGGEEFAVLLPETDSFGALSVASVIRSVIEKGARVSPASFAITVSVGISTWTTDTSTTPDQFIEAADRALYAAKQNGRNRVESVDLQSVISQ